MSSEKESNNSLGKLTSWIKEKKGFVICILVTVLIGMGALMARSFFQSDKKEKNNHFETVTPGVTETNELSEEEKEMVKKYNHYVELYNQTVMKYNSEIKKYNDLLTVLESYDFLDFPQPFSTQDYLIETDSPLDWSEETLNSKKSDMEKIQLNVDVYCEQLIVNTYNSLIDEYNLIAKEYNDAVKLAAVDFLTGLPKSVVSKKQIEKLSEEIIKDNDSAREYIEEEIRCNEELASYLAVVLQITNPSAEWVSERLDKVEGIIEKQAVTLEKDPNQLLGKPGGYTSCTYFSYKEIKQDTVKENDVVDKGAECGGAIEVYANKTDALNRCDYLSQFDDTLLYSGSYILIGSIVIRTSYKLTNQQQIDLTNTIIQAFTE